jgi:peptidoglycan/LPS O-acetylase OafA/YrhL
MHNFSIPGGWAGVDLFFVLSGFLITRILLNTKTDPHYLKMFYARRFLRIFPIYYLSLVCFWMVSPWAGARILWYVFYISDFTCVNMNVAIPGLSHTWSLSVEEQFYLLWPFLVKFATRRRLFALCAFGLMADMVARCCLSLTLPPGPTSYCLYSISSFTRGDGILVGSMMALAVNGGLRHTPANVRASFLVFLGAVAVLGALALTGNLSFDRRTVWMSAFGIPGAVVGGAAALWFGMGMPRTSLVYRLLTVRPLTYVGKISYGLYLYHAMINSGLSDLCSRLDVPSTEGPLFGAFAAAVALAVASASWHLFESPINGLKRYWSYHEATNLSPS